MSDAIDFSADEDPFALSPSDGAEDEDAHLLPGPDQPQLPLPAPPFKWPRGGRGIPLGYETVEPETRAIGFGIPGRKTGAKKPRIRRKLMTDDSERHVLAVAPTGAGKGRNFIIPTLLHCADPAVVIDIKGELANTTAEYRASMGHQIAIIDPWLLTKPSLARYRTSYNPLALLDPDGATFADDCYALASLLPSPNSLVDEPYWNERAEALIAGAMALARSQPGTAEKPADRSLGGVYKHLHGGDVVYHLATVLDTVGGAIHPFAKDQIESLLSLSADITRNCIISCFQSLLRCFASDAVRASLRDGLDPQAIADGRPLTVYLVMPPDKLVSHASLLRLWVASMMGHITRRRTRPARRTLFIIDEAAQLGPMPQLRTAVTLARGYGMRTIIVLQSPAQLKATFEKDWEVFLENCGVLLAFGIDRPSMADTMATWLGDITAGELRKLGKANLAVRQGDTPTRILTRTDMLCDRPFKDRLGSNPMYPDAQGGTR